MGNSKCAGGYPVWVGDVLAILILKTDLAFLA
jgi:hypothetical protein